MDKHHHAINTKNICLLIGTLFGLLIYFCNLFFIPSTIILIIGGIQTFELCAKRRKYIEEHLNFKLQKYEEESLRIKNELELLKNKVNVTQMFGKQ